MSEFLMQVWWLIPAVAGATLWIVIATINRIISRDRRRIEREHRAAQESMGSNATPHPLAQYYTTTGTSISPASSGGFINVSGGIYYHPAAPDLGEPEDFEGEFKGWRMYTIHLANHGRLTLVGSRVGWPSGELVAECNQSAEMCVAHLKAGHCSCGIYMMKALDRQWMSSAFSNWSEVIAQCSASGVVVEHEHGFRAERVRIDRLFVDDTNPDLLESLRKTYGCTVLSLQEHATPLLTGRLT